MVQLKDKLYTLAAVHFSMIVLLTICCSLELDVGMVTLGWWMVVADFAAVSASSFSGKPTWLETQLRMIVLSSLSISNRISLIMVLCWRDLLLMMAAMADLLSEFMIFPIGGVTISLCAKYMVTSLA